MIEFSNSLNRGIFRRCMSEFRHLVYKARENEPVFIISLAKDLSNGENYPVRWPHNYMNSLSVDFDFNMDYLSIQGTDCGIKINPETIAVSVNGIFFVSIPLHLKKDEYFNISVSTDLYNLQYEDIVYLRSLRIALKHYKSYL